MDSAYDPFGGTTVFTETGTLPDGVSFDTSTGLFSGTIAADAASSTPYNITVSASDSAGGNSPSVSFTWTVAAFEFDGPGDQTATVGLPFSLDLAYGSYVPTGGANLTYSVTGLPGGLTLNTATGIISGTPTTAGSFVGSVTASSGTLSVVNNVSWQITAVGVAEPGDQTSSEGQTVTLQLAGVGAGAFTYSASGLPAGLSIDSQSGVISGTIAAGTAGEYEVDVSASSDSGAGSTTFFWTVNPKVSITAVNDQTGTEGQTVNLQIQASEIGGVLTYQAYGLPAGLSIDIETGLITGTISVGAAENGPYFVTVVASDGTNSNSVFFNWNVNFLVQPPAPSEQAPNNQANYPGQTVSLNVNAADADGFDVGYYAENLPDGLFIDPFTGNISGTIADDAVSTTPYTVSVTASDEFGDATTTTFQWTVNAITTPVTAEVYPLTGTAGVLSATMDVASFTSPDLSSQAEDYDAIINWGDEQTSFGEVEGFDGNFVVVASHEFSVGGWLPVSVDITNIWGATPEIVAHGTADVVDAAMTAGSPVQLGALVGQSTSLTLGYFTDANALAAAGEFTASINWEDGSTTLATVASAGPGLFEVTGSHSYSTIGEQDPVITVTDSAGVSLTISGSTVEVGNLYAGVEGTLTLATFTDTNPGVTAGSFAVDITWGDGTTPDSTTANGGVVIVQSGSLFTITASHTFAGDSIDQSGGVYQVTVTITGDENMTTTVPVEVTRPPGFMVVANEPAQLGTTLTSPVLAVFVEPDDTDGTGEFSASINWGDGTTGSGTVQEIGTNTGLFQVVGETHTYSTSPTGSLLVSVSQDWGSSDVAIQGGGFVQQKGGPGDFFRSPTPLYPGYPEYPGYPDFGPQSFDQQLKSAFLPSVPPGHNAAEWALIQDLLRQGYVNVAPPGSRMELVPPSSPGASNPTPPIPPGYAPGLSAPSQLRSIFSSPPTAKAAIAQLEQEIANAPGAAFAKGAGQGFVLVIYWGSFGYAKSKQRNAIIAEYDALNLGTSIRIADGSAATGVALFYTAAGLKVAPMVNNATLPYAIRGQQYMAAGQRLIWARPGLIPLELAGVYEGAEVISPGSGPLAVSTAFDVIFHIGPPNKPIRNGATVVNPANVPLAQLAELELSVADQTILTNARLLAVERGATNFDANANALAAATRQYRAHFQTHRLQEIPEVTGSLVTGIGVGNYDGFTIIVQRVFGADGKTYFVVLGRF